MPSSLWRARVTWLVATILQARASRLPSRIPTCPHAAAQQESSWWMVHCSFTMILSPNWGRQTPHSGKGSLSFHLYFNRLICPALMFFTKVTQNVSAKRKKTKENTAEVNGPFSSCKTLGGCEVTVGRRRSRKSAKEFFTRRQSKICCCF